MPVAHKRPVLLGRRIAATAAAMAAVCGVLAAPALADAQGSDHHSSRSDRLIRGDLLLSRSVYTPPYGLQVGTPLPPGCPSTQADPSNCVTATTDGTYPTVFNNDLVDGSFGLTTRVLLDELTPTWHRHATIAVPVDDMVTSFSSKSELALNPSTNGRVVSFMGYAAPLGGLDVSNSNTPGIVDPTNPVGESFYRVVATVDAFGRMTFTETNAYSGNNGRAAILNSADNVFYTAGNAGNGSGTQPPGILLAAGAQLIHPSTQPESAQSPGTPTPVASFSVTELGDKADKLGKDDNFRGIGIYHDVLYFTKGSGSDGVNTLYFVDTSPNRSACPNGVGLPASGATLPTSPLAYDPSTLSGTNATGLPSNMCILAGFPTTPEKSSPSPDYHPFGFWFANPHTLYLADEGGGTNTYAGGEYTDAASQTVAGLQKWIFDSWAQQWKLAYTIQNGLELGQPYTVPGYPTGVNPATVTASNPTGTPWAPATDGLRNLTGETTRGGLVTIWATTSTVSGGGDQGADPNKLVAVVDPVDATTPPAWERFVTVRRAPARQMYRGVSFTPGTR